VITPLLPALFLPLTSALLAMSYRHLTQQRRN